MLIQMVAPVRETVSQSLASLVLHMPRRSVLHVRRILLDMIFQPTDPNANGHTLETDGHSRRTVSQNLLP